jgi:hypothetical protein
VDGGGADDEFRAFDVISIVADGDRNAQRTQMPNRRALVQVGTGDDEAHAEEHLGQGGHGYAADPHQVGMPAWLNVAVDAVCCHGVYTPFL